jgi:hypothetical protein
MQAPIRIVQGEIQRRISFHPVTHDPGDLLVRLDLLCVLLDSGSLLKVDMPPYASCGAR